MLRRRTQLPLLLLVGAAALGACKKTGSEPKGYGVNVTIDATMVSSADRGRITTVTLTVVDDTKMGSTPVVKSLAVLMQLQGGKVTFTYVPGADVDNTDTLELGVDASSAGGTLVASGASGKVVLMATAVDAKILLTGVGDGGAGGKANGTACVTGAECGSTFCADGVCCNEKCDDVCVSCNQTAATKGMCTAYAANTDPEMECAAKILTPPPAGDAGTTMADGSTDASAEASTSSDGGGVEASASDGSTSGASDASGSSDADESDALVLNAPDGGFMTTPNSCAGTCGGARSCKYPGTTTSCGKAFCNTRKEVGSFFCDGNGGCDTTLSECTDYTCNDVKAACSTSCSGPLDCQLGKYCSVNSTCVDRKVDGIACGTDDECRNDHCAIPAGGTTGVCCNTKCDSPFTCNQSGSVGSCQCPGVVCGAGIACQLFYRDGDGDGYGDASGTIALGTAQAGCTGSPPAGFVADNTDCDDGDPNVHPGQTAFFATVSAGKHTFDYDCDGSIEKETPEFPGGSCKFCGVPGACATTSPYCAAAKDTASFQCPEERTRYVNEPVAMLSEAEPALARLGKLSLAPLAAPATAPDVTSYASVVPPGGAICLVCEASCCGCSAGDKTGFLQTVTCGDATKYVYTCGACAVAKGAASAMTGVLKQQRCR
jgi:hypothetical protein